MNRIKLKKAVFAAAAVLLLPVETLALEKLGEAVSAFSAGKYERALKRVESYLEEYPADALAAKFLNTVRSRLASRALKRGYTFISEGIESSGVEELMRASGFHSGYVSGIEERFTELLKDHDRRAAANLMLLEIIKNPTPADAEVNGIFAGVRGRLAGSMTEVERLDFESLTDRIEKLRKKGEWSGAVDMILDYMEANPGSADANLFLSEINRDAARDYYGRALEQVGKNRLRAGRELAQSSRSYDPEWYEKMIESEMEAVKLKIATGDLEEAKEHLEIIQGIEPGNPNPALYLSLFDENRTGFLERSVEEYRNREYKAAAARFDFLRLREPDNRQAQLYYHLSSARAFIKERNLEKIREHLLMALKISPGEQEALDIFDRLQDVIEILGET